MLSRILEPEVMDTPEEARDYDAMDHSGVNRVFVEDFLALWNGHFPILDVGTGTAQIPIALAHRSPVIREIVAIDLAEHMLALGRGNVRAAGLEKVIRLERVNARTMPYAAGAFAALISNSIVHHIPEPATVFAEMVRVARPGAVLFVRDLCRPVNAEKLHWIVETYAATANDHQRAMFAASLHAALTLDEVRELVAAQGFDPAGVSATSDRHWTWAAVKPR